MEINVLLAKIDLDKLQIIINRELDKITDRLKYHKSELVNDKTDLKQYYKLGALNKTWLIDTSIDAALYYIINQVINSSTNKYLLQIMIQEDIENENN